MISVAALRIPSQAFLFIDKKLSLKSQVTFIYIAFNTIQKQLWVNKQENNRANVKFSNYETN